MGKAKEGKTDVHLILSKAAAKRLESIANLMGVSKSLVAEFAIRNYNFDAIGWTVDKTDGPENPL